MEEEALLIFFSLIFTSCSGRKVQRNEHRKEVQRPEMEWGREAWLGEFIHLVDES